MRFNLANGTELEFLKSLWGLGTGEECYAAFSNERKNVELETNLHPKTKTTKNDPSQKKISVI